MSGEGGLQVPEINTGFSSKKEPATEAGSPQPIVATPQMPFGTSNKVQVFIESPEEMAALKRIFRVLNFGVPGTAKTHLGLDMPAPVIAIDTEERVHIISKKFKHCKSCNHDWYAKTFECPKCGSKDIWFKDIRRIKVRNVDELDAAIDNAIIILQDVKNRTGVIGTIMVDSWTESWNMVHDEHYDKYYSGLTPSEIQLSPRDDYKHINPRHNKIRNKLLASGFNVYLTATECSVYGKGDDQFDIVAVKPEGQKHNPHAVDWWIHSFHNAGKIGVIFEKNSIAQKDGSVLYEFDYALMCKTAEELEKKEKMLTLELLEQIEKEIQAGNDIEEPSGNETEEPNNDEVKK